MTILIILLVITLLVPDLAVELSTAPLALAISESLPDWLADKGVLLTPFGGVLRTDFLILALACALIARLFHWISRKFA